MLNPEQNTVDIHELSPLSLAFLGDGVIELLVRARLVGNSRRPPASLHREAAQIVSARGQFGALTALEPHLTESEQSVVRRGRNANKATVSKNATAQEYRASTGMEALFGWLYLKQDITRIEELFEIIWKYHVESHSA